MLWPYAFFFWSELLAFFFLFELLEHLFSQERQDTYFDK